MKRVHIRVGCRDGPFQGSLEGQERPQEDTMKSTITIIAIGLLASSLTTSAGAATQRKNAGMAQLQAQCQAQAKKKYSAIHFLKRRAFVKSCMHQKA
jgi:hypothetical protein